MATVTMTSKGNDSGWFVVSSELAPKSSEFLMGLFRAMDASDAAGFASHFHEDGVMRFANTPSVWGRQNVEESIRGFQSTIKSVQHLIEGVWRGEFNGDAVWSVEAGVVYTLLDGTTVETLPCTSTMRMRGELIADYRIFIDPAPLFRALRPK
jgi:ketosteroid isomerase-like protein